MTRDQLLQRLERAWTTLTDSYTGLIEAQLSEPGVVGDWSVKDILAHVTTWEDEALTHLPVISAGGLDAFNAKTSERKRAFSLTEVLQQLHKTHRRLLDYIASMPDELFATATRFRHRLRLDTYHHYPLHAEMIHAWRERHAL